MTTWLEQFIENLTRMAPDGSFFSYAFNIKALIAVFIVGLVCGAVGPLVVGNRMAFFSDALAHCVFAGAAFGLLIGVSLRLERGSSYYQVGIPLVMVGFGVLMGLGIGWVRGRTGMANDTAIGVFFATSIGLGALFIKMISRYGISAEQLMFGDPFALTENDLLLLTLLAVATFGLLLVLFNSMLFGTFNQSLARLRGVPVQICTFVLLVMLALIVGLTLRTVGGLLINSLLIVPAATACNVCRNLRQMFWTSVGLSMAASIGGLWISWELTIHGVEVGTGGAIVLLIVMMFFLSMALGPRLRGQQATVPRGQ